MASNNGFAKKASVILGTELTLLDGNGGRICIEPKSPRGKKVRSMRVLPGQYIRVSANSPTDDLLEIRRDDTGDHPTQKPVALAVRAIENSSLPGDIICDGFLDSGTTVIAAEKAGRICCGTELTPWYCKYDCRAIRTLPREQTHSCQCAALKW